MDTRKFELDALSDDQLDAMSGGDRETKEAAAIKGFQQALQELPQNRRRNPSTRTGGTRPPQLAASFILPDRRSKAFRTL
jgi:hypothetical protein